MTPQIDGLNPISLTIQFLVQTAFSDNYFKGLKTEEDGSAYLPNLSMINMFTRACNKENE